MDMEELEEAELDDQQRSIQMLSKEPNGSLTKRIHLTVSDLRMTDDGQTDPEIHWMESSGLFPAYPVCMSHDRWTISGEEELCELFFRTSTTPCCIPVVQKGAAERSPSPMLDYRVFPENPYEVDGFEEKEPASLPVPPQLDVPHLSISVPGSVVACPEVSNFASNTSSPIGCLCSLTSSSCDPLSSASGVPGSSDQDPVSAAAHLHLLGESLSLIGHHLKETDKSVCMSSSFSLLLDSLLCALAPLMCLTTQIPELTSCTEYALASTLENVAYVMPGL